MNIFLTFWIRCMIVLTILFSALVFAAIRPKSQPDVTLANVPVMTRLHMEERQLLDTLIDAGVARSRSEALAWTVRLVADNEAEWIGKLQEAMEDLSKLRDAGPSSAG